MTFVPSTTTNYTPLHSNYPPQAGWQPAAPGGFYLPGWVDTVPHLLPDIHPWWYPLGSASNIEWRPCASSRNVALYINPMVGIINPIGAGVSSTPLANWNWLDDLYWSWYSGGAPFGALFMNEDSSARPGTTGLANVNPGSGSAWLWCALHSAGTVYPLQPSQDPRLVAAPLTNTMRVSCEWLRGSTPFGDPRGGNIQSFMIWR
jgi:hypothetical protein